MTNDSRTAAAAALAAYREARGRTSNDAEDLVDLVSDLAHLADLSDDPDLTGTNLLIDRDVAEDTAGEDVLSSAFDNYQAEK